MEERELQKKEEEIEKKKKAIGRYYKLKGLGIHPSKHDDNTSTESNDLVAPPTTTTTDDLTVEETSGKRKHNFEELAAKKPEMSEREDTIHNRNMILFPVDPLDELIEEKEPPRHHPKCRCEKCSEYRYKVQYHT